MPIIEDKYMWKVSIEFFWRVDFWTMASFFSSSFFDIFIYVYSSYLFFYLLLLGNNQFTLFFSLLFSKVRQNRSLYLTFSTFFFPLLLLLLLSLLLCRMFLSTNMSPSRTPTVLRQTDRHIFILFRFCACTMYWGSLTGRPRGALGSASSGRRQCM